MAKKKKESSQGEIIDELRKVRAQVWREYETNPKRFFADSRKIMKRLGIRYATPRKRRSGSEEDAA